MLVLNVNVVIFPPNLVIMLNTLVQLEGKCNLMDFKYKTEKNNFYVFHANQKVLINTIN